MIKFIDFCEVWFLPDLVARIAAIVGDPRCHTPRHSFKETLDVFFRYSRPSSVHTLPKLIPTLRRCSTGCLKYRQSLKEECESDIQYRPIP
ncbi:uncharacterized protein TNCV_826181 [Trichonephila clavipes]|nr:uncharacterized protein TNCV_826181 [Trichonephila clavipes]